MQTSDFTAVTLARLLEEGEAGAGAAKMDQIALVFAKCRNLYEQAQPRICVVVNCEDFLVGQEAIRLTQALSEWTVRFASAVPEEPLDLMDAGIVITRATQPLREPETQLFARYVPTAPVWHVLCPDAESQDEEDIDELWNFLRNAFVRISGCEPAKLWSSESVAIEGLSAAAYLRRRPARILGHLQQTLSEFSVELTRQKHIAEAKRDYIRPDATNTQTAFKTAEEKIRVLDNKVTRDLQAISMACMNDFRQRLAQLEQLYSQYIDDVPLSDIPTLAPDFLNSRLRNVRSEVLAETQSQLETFIDEFTRQREKVLQNIVVDHPGLFLSPEIYLAEPQGSSTPRQRDAVGAAVPRLRDALMSVALGGMVGSLLLPILAIPIGLGTLILTTINTNRQQAEQERFKWRNWGREKIRDVRSQGQEELQRHLSEITSKLLTECKSVTELTVSNLKVAFNIADSTQNLKDAELEIGQLIRHGQLTRDLLEQVERALDRISFSSRSGQLDENEI